MFHEAPGSEVFPEEWPANNATGEDVRRVTASMNCSQRECGEIPESTP